MKKFKVAALALVAFVAAISLVGGSLAWFADSTEKTNVFTLGKISIELHDENKPATPGTCGTDFTQGQILLPIVNTDDPTADAGYINKVVHVKNTGNAPAYVRAYVLTPAAIDSILNLSLNETDWTKESDDTYTVIDGVEYKVRQYRYVSELGAGTQTYDLLTGVYMDAAADVNKDGKLCKGETVYDFTIDDARSVKIPVAVQAVQAQGFADDVTALDTAFPETPWGATYKKVSANDVAEALSSLESGNALKLTANPTAAAAGEKTTYAAIDLTKAIENGGELKNVTITGEDGVATQQIVLTNTDAGRTDPIKIDNIKVENVIFDNTTNPVQAFAFYGNYKEGDTVGTVEFDSCSFPGNTVKDFNNITTRVDENFTGELIYDGCDFSNTRYAYYNSGKTNAKTVKFVNCKFDSLKSWAFLFNGDTDVERIEISGCEFSNFTDILKFVGGVKNVDTFIFKDNKFTNCGAINFTATGLSCETVVISGNQSRATSGDSYVPLDLTSKITFAAE